MFLLHSLVNHMLWLLEINGNHCYANHFISWARNCLGNFLWMYICVSTTLACSPTPWMPRCICLSEPTTPCMPASIPCPVDKVATSGVTPDLQEWQWVKETLVDVHSEIKKCHSSMYLCVPVCTPCILFWASVCLASTVSSEYMSIEWICPLKYYTFIQSTTTAIQSDSKVSMPGLYLSIHCSYHPLPWHVCSSITELLMNSALMPQFNSPTSSLMPLPLFAIPSLLPFMCLNSSLFWRLGPGIICFRNCFLKFTHIHTHLQVLDTADQSCSFLHSMAPCSYFRMVCINAKLSVPVCLPELDFMLFG